MHILHNMTLKKLKMHVILYMLTCVMLVDEMSKVLTCAPNYITQEPDLVRIYYQQWVLLYTLNTNRAGVACKTLRSIIYIYIYILFAEP